MIGFNAAVSSLQRQISVAGGLCCLLYLSKLLGHFQAAGQYTAPKDSFKEIIVDIYRTSTDAS